MWARPSLFDVNRFQNLVQDDEIELTSAMLIIGAAKRHCLTECVSKYRAGCEPLLPICVGQPAAQDNCGSSRKSTLVFENQVDIFWNEPNNSSNKVFGSGVPVTLLFG